MALSSKVKLHSGQTAVENDALGAVKFAPIVAKKPFYLKNYELRGNSALRVAFANKSVGNAVDRKQQEQRNNIVELTVSRQRSDDTIVWTKMWWPVAAMDSLDPKAPTHVDLLGKSMVVWADSQGKWHCFQDRCPHRLAPLSEGRVEKDGLMCSYHGWTFASDGKCVTIPQIDKDSPAHARACASPRSCVTSYPVCVQYGLLWVWPEPGNAAADMAAATPVVELQGENMSTWLVRDLPIRYDTLMENVVDPSHVSFSHHGIAGSRYKAATYPDMTCDEVSKGGYRVTMPKPSGVHSYVDFKAPMLCTYSVAGVVGQPQAVVVPTKPGYSRIFLNNSLNVPYLPDWAKPIAKAVISWTAFDHAFRQNTILDGDTYFLHVAERQVPLAKGLGSATFSKEYFMPAAADATVLGLRKWLQQYGGVVPTCAPEDAQHVPPLMPKEQALNRWEQHTKHCVHCRTEVERIDKALNISTIGAAVSAFSILVNATVGAYIASGQVPAAAASAATAMPWWQACQAAGLQDRMIWAAGLAVLCWLLQKPLRAYRNKFFYEEYVHAKKD